MCLSATLLSASQAKHEKTQSQSAVPVLALAGGRKLDFERVISADRDVAGKRSLWTRVVDTIAGAPERHELVRPFGVVADSQGRIIVTDPGSAGVHIFDIERKKYQFIAHAGRDDFKSPLCVAVDDQDNIYFTDSDAGKVYVFTPAGKFARVIGSLKGGEGFFKRPTGIAVDSAANRLYVTDTARHKIFVMDMVGNVLQTIGQRGSEPGEFNFPTELRLHGDELVVVDSMNFRVQRLDKSGRPIDAIGVIGEVSGTMFRPKGVAFDSEGNLYVVDGLFETVQVFDRQGRLLYYFGREGTGPQEFQLPTGMFIDHNDRIFVVDSMNRRVQLFRYQAAGKTERGGL